MINASGITKSFGSLQVLKGVDFSAAEGEMVSIMGASGAGKTTLLQILGTLSSPDSGTLSIAGKTVFGQGRHLAERDLAAFRSKHIGFVFQAHHLLPEFTALENVMIPALIAGTSSSRAKEHALELLSKVGLDGRASHKPAELSGGEAQRVAIARALVNRPAVLFADEPTGNLDSATKLEIHALLLDLKASLGQTTVIVTHDPSLSAICDRTLNMVDGRFTEGF
ncbi:MAG: ABC transporter ATP-binding protein [Bacteroidales bacterium]|nr:ABC transporter ATP-binding protein [Candidatus Cryptobacteroides aphodequi]